MSKFSISVAWSDEYGEFVATTPEFPDLSGLGDTAESALSELSIAIEGAVEVYEDEGWELPEPLTLQQFSGQFRVRLPKSLHQWLSSRASTEGVSLNTLVCNILSAAQGSGGVLTALGAEMQRLAHRLPYDALDIVRARQTSVSAGWYLPKAGQVVQVHRSGGYDSAAVPPFAMVEREEAIDGR